MTLPVSAKLEKIVTNPLITLIYRGVVLLVGAIIAVSAWWMKSYATLPEQVVSINSAIVEVRSGVDETKERLGQLSGQAKDALRDIEDLKRDRDVLRADAKAQAAAVAFLDRSFAESKVQNTEVLRRLDSIDRRFERVADKLGVP